MKDKLHLRLRPDVKLQTDGDDLLAALPDGQAMRQRSPDAAQRMLMECLTAAGGTTDQLLERVLENCQSADTGKLYYLLYSLEAKSFLAYSAVDRSGQVIATLEPVSARFRYQSNGVQNNDASLKFRLSRFAWLRREGEFTLLECSLAYARLVLHDARVASLLAHLAKPCSVHDLLSLCPAFTAVEISTLLELLSIMQAVAVCDAAGLSHEDNDPALRQWEYHDLLFHSRSRMGRSACHMDSNYRFMGDLPHESALKPSSDTPRIKLPEPEALPTLDFFAVVEQRRSIRTAGQKPLTMQQLADFLWHVARVQIHYQPVDDNDPIPYEATLRPCASGGAMHEIELYLTVSRCEGLESALYRYVPDAHALERIADLGTAQQQLIDQVVKSTGAEQAPDIVITLGARFGRVTWKYQSFAYALILKNVGALYQQMYLVATALSLAPCGVGVGDADLLAECIGSNYYAESSVGEFMLSGRN